MNRWRIYRSCVYKLNRIEFQAGFQTRCGMKIYRHCKNLFTSYEEKLNFSFKFKVSRVGIG